MYLQWSVCWQQHNSDVVRGTEVGEGGGLVSSSLHCVDMVQCVVYVLIYFGKHSYATITIRHKGKNSLDIENRMCCTHLILSHTTVKHSAVICSPFIETMCVHVCLCVAGSYWSFLI